MLESSAPETLIIVAVIVGAAGLAYVALAALRHSTNFIFAASHWALLAMTAYALYRVTVASDAPQRRADGLSLAEEHAPLLAAYLSVAQKKISLALGVEAAAAVAERDRAGWLWKLLLRE